MDGPPPRRWTLADLELIRLEVAMDDRLGHLTATLTPEEAAAWEERARHRTPDQLPVPDCDLAPSESVPAMAEQILAELTDDERTLRALAGSRYQGTLLHVAENPATPLAVLLGLARHTCATVVRAATGHPRLRADHLEDLYRTGGVQIRVGVLSRIDVPRHLVEKGASDAAHDVRCAAAGHPRLAPALLEALADDPAQAVRLAAARNPAASSGLLARLAADPDRDVRQSVALHPATDTTTARVLAADPSSCVRLALARGPALLCEPALAGLLSADEDEHVREELAANPACPAEVLVRLGRRGQPVTVRRAVAANPACPADVRTRLAADPSPYVRRAARC
ncbi:hypothetical protein [Actinocorallia aurantiaca]|uniref:Leucine rich repeat (LRR) protein n=1 Tax=Actinocorallia aurantiaca TaxID=46204 RepID=A0ABN3UGR5_9ACTN